MYHEAVIHRGPVRNVLQKKEKKSCKIHRKTPVPESLFNKVIAKKRTLAQVFSCKDCHIF